MKKLSKLTAILSLCFAASLVSCSNLIDGEGSSSSKTASQKAWITVDVENKDSSSRTLLPAIEITKLVLKGSLSGQEEERLASADTLALMNAKNIEITTGEWTFTLTADVSGASYSGSTTKTIQENSENPLTFTLSPENGARGKLDFTLTLTEDSAKNIDSSYKAKIELKNLATSVTEEADAEITSKISYKNNSLEEGNYLLTVNILSDKITAASDAEKLLNTFQSIVRIKAGITTTASIKDINLNDIYSITYENIEDDDSLVSGSVTQVHKFSRKTTGTGKIIIPEYENTSPTGTLTFDGWYYDNAFTQTAELEKDGSSYYIDVNSSPKLKDYTIYAKWLVSASGNISTPFDYNFTFDLKTQKDSPARTILPEQETTFKLTTAVTKNGTAIPLTIEDGKTFLDDKEVTWTANLWNDGKLAESITVTPDASTGKINLTVPALTFQDTYILKITANYCGLSFDANYLIKCEPRNPMLTVPLTLEAIEAGAVVTFSNKASGSVTYKVNGGTDQTIESGESTPITLTAAGDKVSFYGDNAAYGVSSDTVSDNTNISCSKNCYVYGNIMSLIKSSDFENETELTADYTFAYLFRNNTKIKNKTGSALLLPATSISGSCYNSMFYGGTGLTSAPALPATTLTNSCYIAMFSGCTGLTSAPVLPANSLTDKCYKNMFEGCTSLTAAPALPATTLADYCYESMFNGCTSLTSAPALPATTLASCCYRQMFEGCTSLASAPALPATTLTTSCYIAMFSDCTSLTIAAELPATTLANYCYKRMFSGCTSLTTAPALPVTTLASSCYQQMFYGCTSLTSAPELPATTLEESCYFSMFNGCTSLTTAPELPATTLADFCYESMFEDCTSLTAAPALPATTLASCCYRSMFNGCTNLTTAPALPATTLTSNCYYSMFRACTSLTTAPELPATTLADSCYDSMFQGCTSLNSVTCLATDISAISCTSNWLSDVAATGTFTKAPGMTGWTTGASGIPSGWTVGSKVSLANLTSAYTAQDGDVLSGTTSRNITIASGATVTLNGATMNKGFVCEGDATIILEGDNTAKGSGRQDTQTVGSAVRIGPAGTTFTLKGTGSLTATVTYGLGAAIGLDGVWATSQEGGTIVIESGTINTTTAMGAGIGCGSIYSNSSLHATLEGIIIKGGTITATITDNSGNGAEYSATAIGYGYSYDTHLNNRSEGRFNVNTIEIYDTITSLDLHSLANSVVYKHGNTDVTSTKETYFNITENGRARVITPKN